MPNCVPGVLEFEIVCLRKIIHTSVFYTENPGSTKTSVFLEILGGAAVKGSMAARAGDAPPGPWGGTMPPS